MNNIEELEIEKIEIEDTEKNEGIETEIEKKEDTKVDIEEVRLEYKEKLEEIGLREEKLLKKEQIIKRHKASLKKREDEYEEELAEFEEEKNRFKEEKVKIYREAEEYANKEIEECRKRNKELAMNINELKNVEHENEILKDSLEKYEKTLEIYKEEIRKNNLLLSEYERNCDLEEIRDLKDSIESLEEKEKEIRELRNLVEELKRNNIELNGKVQTISILEENNMILTGKIDRYKAQMRYIKRLEEAKGTGEDSSQGVFQEIITIQQSNDEKESPIRYIGDEKFVDEFVEFCDACGFIYSKVVVRNFLAAIKSSKMTILKGYSGTGKSSLPNLFASFIKGECVIVPVQPNWRTKQDIVGFYNYFTNKFIPTELTKALIRANVSKERIFLIVLDEMNLARVEYYFSEFNSKLWLSEKDREIELFEGNVEYEGIVGNYIKGNSIRIPNNVYFIGTINEDDSVSAISDKIFDRAQVVDFLELPKSDKVGDLEKANSNKQSEYTRYSTFVANIKEDKVENSIKIIDEVNEFVKENFNKVIGFRSLKQAKVFVTAYTNAGGKKAEAIDLQLVSKFMPKLKFMYSDEQIEGLEFLIDEIKELYKIEFDLSEESMENLNIVKQLRGTIKELQD